MSRRRGWQDRAFTQARDFFEGIEGITGDGEEITADSGVTRAKAGRGDERVTMSTPVCSV